jgi:release factor glutamine methyltransferase
VRDAIVEWLSTRPVGTEPAPVNHQVAAVLAATAHALAEAGIESAEAEARWLLEAASGWPPLVIRLEPERQLDVASSERLAAMLARRLRREPLQRIVGAAPFFGLQLRALAGVLIPRPETERLVELALASIRGLMTPRVHDLGCGSGAIAIAIKVERPDAQVSASDIDPAALRATRSNAADAAVELQLFEADLLQGSEVQGVLSGCDLLVSNPPYLPTSDRGSLPLEVRSEPEHALLAGEDGLDVARRLLQQVAELPRKSAAPLTIWLELDPRNAPVLAAELEAEARWFDVRLEADLSGRWRFLHARCVATAPSESATLPPS